MKARKILITAVLSALFGTAAAGQNSIVGSFHDFSGTGWTDEICLPCHTPHFSIADELGLFPAPLWNHTLTTATYTMYKGDTAVPAGPDDGTAAFSSLTRLCMSCHDGTVALDSFGGNVGGTTIDARAMVGTDLQNDHPIGYDAVYPELGGDGTDFRGTGGDGNLGTGGELVLETMLIVATPTQTVGCTTCHDPHKGAETFYFLNIDNTNSDLCLSCHIK